MLVSIIAEFIFGYILDSFDIVAVDNDSISNVCSFGDVIGDASSLVCEALEEVLQDRIRSTRQRQRLTSAQILTYESVCTRFVDVILAGDLGEFTASAISIGFVLAEALLVTFGEPYALIGRGFDAVAAIVEGNSLFGIVLALFDIFALVIRPLSLTIRIVANLTTGTLLAGLLTANSAVLVVDSLLATTVAGSAVGVCAAVIVILGLNVVETFVGVLQVYVFATLSTTYVNVLRE